MNREPWGGADYASAVRKAYQILAEHGSREQRAAANDVLSGRHSPRELLYLSDHSGAGLASLNRLAERWQQATDEERAAAREGADQAISALLTRVADLEVPPAKRPVHPAPEDDDDDFTEERYTGPAY